MKDSSTLQQKIVHFLAIALVFGLAYTQDPIYNSPENQNTKFLHGLAAAHYGFLNQDWMASTTDPFPAFSFLVQTTAAIHPEYLFYLYYLLLFGVYAYSAIGIADYVFHIRKNRTTFLVFLLLLLIVHNIHIEIFRFDTGWHLHAGMAGQYILGPVFQPANFGAFLLLSIHLFLYGRSLLAILCLGIAASFHPAYLPSAGILTIAYMAITFFNEKDPKKNLRKSLVMGAFSLALVIPVCAYMYSVTSSPDAEIQALAQEIIVEQRIPHHSLPLVWLQEPSVYVQAGLIMLALFFLRKTKLFPIFAISFGAVVLSVLLQIATDSDFIALIAPWRISVFLVPLSTCLIAARLEMAVLRKVLENPGDRPQRQQRFIQRFAMTAIAILVIYTSVEQVLSFYYTDDSLFVMNYVKQHKQSGQTYLVPPDSRPMRKFRLYTGAPIFVNAKTHPYQAEEVVEWSTRLHLARMFYQEGSDRCALLPEFSSGYGITHAILERERMDANCPQFSKVYEDEEYGLYALENL